jgi:sodium/hydrogen antiporter
LYIGEAILAFLFGVIIGQGRPSSFRILLIKTLIGPYGANIFNPRHWGDGDSETTQAITLEITRVVLAVGVFAIGVELPSKYMKKHYKSILFLSVSYLLDSWCLEKKTILIESISVWAQ